MMKKFLFTIILIGSSIVSSCKTDDFIEEIQITQDSIPEVDGIRLKIDKYMSQNSAGSVQGASCYGDYLFQFQDHNANVYVYNLKEKTYVETVSMNPIGANHCNNVSFSNVFYNTVDEFPLLYVSGSSSGTYNQVQVYRVQHIADSFSFEKIQNIIMPKGNETNNMYWTQVIMDNENSYMYVLSKTRSNGKTFISKMNIPSLDNEQVQLMDDDIIDQYEVSDSVHKQGAVIYKGFMYIMYGVPVWGDTNYLRVIDLSNREDYMTVNISKMGFKQEFEGLTVYKDVFIAPANANAGIFSIKFYTR